MKIAVVSRISPLVTLLLLTSCDQHTTVLQEAERLETENSTVHQQIQAAEQQLIALGAGKPFAAANYQQQTTVAMNAQKGLQKEVTQMAANLLVVEPKLKEMKEKVKIFIDRQGR